MKESITEPTNNTHMLNILTYNCRRSPTVLTTLLELVGRASVDVLLLQEIPAQMTSSSVLEERWRILLPQPDPSALIARHRDCRTATYLNKNTIAATSIAQILLPDTGDVVVCDIETAAGSLRLINVYNCPTFHVAMSMLKPVLEVEEKEKMVVVAGDMNVHHPMWEPAWSGPISAAVQTAIEVLPVSSSFYRQARSRTNHTTHRMCSIWFSPILRLLPMSLGAELKTDSMPGRITVL